MLIDQDEINALLAQASQLSDECDSGEPPPPPRPAETAQKVRQQITASPEIARLLRIRVPVIVQLARRRMRIEAIRRLSSGAIVEFDRNVEDPLDLLINNRRIGQGVAVKVGESFGLRIVQIGSPAARIRSLGG